MAIAENIHVEATRHVLSISALCDAQDVLVLCIGCILIHNSSQQIPRVLSSFHGVPENMVL